MRAARAYVIAVALCMAILVAGLVYLATRTTASSGGNLKPAGPHITGGVTRTISAAGLSITFPSDWSPVQPQSGFQYVAEYPVRHQFVGVGIRTASAVTSAAQLRSARLQSLHGFVSNISSAQTGTVDGHPAVRFRYEISSAGISVSDVEYDVLLGRQSSSTKEVIIVLGGPPPYPSDLERIAASIHFGS